MSKWDPGTPWGGRFRPLPDSRILPEPAAVPPLIETLRDAIQDDLLRIKVRSASYDQDKEPTIHKAYRFAKDRLYRIDKHLELVHTMYTLDDQAANVMEALCFNEANGVWFRDIPYQRYTKDLTPAKRKKFDQEERDRRIASARLLARAAKKLRDEESDKDLVAVHEIYDQEDWDLAMATVQSGDIVQLANELDAKIEYRGNPFDPDANTGAPITFTMTREGPPQ